jgi:PiT family inorganic phosphate transporter
MGIITVLLYSTGYLHGDFQVPHWVALSCYVAIGLGTLTGGWRIIETMGTRITKLNQHQGFSASAGGSIMLFAASYLGIPVSTTHTITGCVIGAGAARRASAVRWGIARNVMIAWIITIPASATVAAVFYYMVSGTPTRAALIAAAIALLSFTAFAWRGSRARRPASA